VRHAVALALVLVLVPLARGDDSEDRPIPPDVAARLALRQLVGRQERDGSFAEPHPQGFKLYERYVDGTNGLAGLAILAHVPDHPSVQKAMGHVLSRQRDDGCLAPKASKCNLEHGYCLQFLVEVALAHRAGDLELDSARWAALDRAITRAAGYLVREQLADGSWSYGAERSYRETATWTPVMEALLLARRLGLALPPRVVRAGLAYLDSRRLADGWLNGENERVSSPHMSASILAVLECVGDDAAAYRAWSRELVAALPGRGYLDRWGYEPTDPKIDQYAALKQDLAARRILYGTYYVTLCHARRGDRGAFLAWHARVAAHLVAHRAGEVWTSTAGEVASTSLALLTLGAARGRLALYGDLGGVPALR